MLANTRVSVVVPCFNSQRYLRQTLTSLDEQTYPHFEVVLVDDGSTDASVQIARAWMQQNPQRLSTLITQTNRGVAAARNAAIAVARGPYILPLDSDDCLTENFLAEGVTRLDEVSETALVFTDRREFGNSSTYWRSGSFDLAALRLFNQIPYAALFRKIIWQGVGGYRSNVDGFDDWDFWIACAARGFRGERLEGPLLLHRDRADSQFWQIVERYESLFARIILNNSAVYSPGEVLQARAWLESGARSSLLSASRFLFLNRLRNPGPDAVNPAELPNALRRPVADPSSERFSCKS